MSSGQSNDLEMIVSHYIRSNYENRYNEQHIPMALKYVILKFSKKLLESNLLCHQKDLDLAKILTTKLFNVRKATLLYRASEHGYCAKKFHSFCDDKGPTVTVIQSNHGNIFGGYISRSWKPELVHFRGHCIIDENAFLFLIKSNEEEYDEQCPLSFDIKKGMHQWDIDSGYKYGPIFGAGSDIFIAHKYQFQHYVRKNSFEYGGFAGSLCGHEEDVFDIIDYEVFALDHDVL